MVVRGGLSLPQRVQATVSDMQKEVSFAFIVVKSMPVPRVRCMPERWTNREREEL